MLVEHLHSQLVLPVHGQRVGQLVAAVLQVGQLGRQLDGPAGLLEGGRWVQALGHDLAEELLHFGTECQVVLEESVVR